MTSLSFTKDLIVFMKRTGHKPGPLCVGMPTTELAYCNFCQDLFYLVNNVYITRRGKVICSVGDKVTMEQLKEFLCPRLEILR